MAGCDVSYGKKNKVRLSFNEFNVKHMQKWQRHEL